MSTIAVIAAARPNFMKIAPILRAFETRGIGADLVHTGQHFDRNMSEIFFQDLGIRAPEVNLGVGGGSHAAQTAGVMLAYEKYVLTKSPKWTVVVGDVNSTLACALVAAKCGSKVCHVEAGLRSRDWSMPEEVNRVLTDRLSDLLLTPTEDADANLMGEGINADRIVCVGNSMIDTLYYMLPKAKESKALETYGLKPKEYALMTLHRPSNVDSAEALGNAVSIIVELAKSIRVVFPIHPRTRKMLREFGCAEIVEKNKMILLCEPLGYVDFMRLTLESSFVITDSGGLQEETTVLGIPCLTMRENTERPITVEKGTNELVGSSKEKVLGAASRILRGEWKKGEPIPLWDGKAAERIAEEFSRRI